MDLASPADKIADSLGIKGVTPAFATVAAALMHPATGAKSAVSDKYGNFRPTNPRNQYISDFFVNYDTNDQVTNIGLTGLVSATTTLLAHRMHSPGGYDYNRTNLGVQDTYPVVIAAGLDISGKQATAIGQEISTHYIGASGRPFVVGNDPGFFMRVSLTVVTSVQGAEPLIVGFRKPTTTALDYTTYSDYACIGLPLSAATPSPIKIMTENAGSATAAFDTGNTWANAATKVFEVQINSGGVPTFLINGAAPTNAYTPETMLDGCPMIPFIQLIQKTTGGATVTGVVTLNSYEVGYLP